MNAFVDCTQIGPLRGAPIDRLLLLHGAVDWINAPALALRQIEDSKRPARTASLRPSGPDCFDRCLVRDIGE